MDGLGLVAALQTQVSQLNRDTGRVQITITASPEPLPALPATVEVATYRIALEAITNVVRHRET